MRVTHVITRLIVGGAQENTVASVLGLKDKPGLKPDPEIARAVNWPAQLICYFAGKEQILALKRDYKLKQGDASGVGAVESAI